MTGEEGAVLVALGANLPSPVGPPRTTCEAALAALAEAGAAVLARSRWYRSAPVPPSGQPWYVNGVARVAWRGAPEALLDLLLAVEAGFGRRRGAANAARTLDLDLLAFGDRVMRGPRLELPHPRLQERAFVLLPLAEVAPGWRHPVTGRLVEDMIAALPGDQQAIADE